MRELVLTEKQTSILCKARKPVKLLDRRGRILAYVSPPWTEAQIAEAKRVAAYRGPVFSGKQIQRQLKALEKEWTRTGGFDKAYMMKFLAKLDEKDPPRIRHAESVK